MAMWCRVTISYAATGYTQNYKRDIVNHNHTAAQGLTTDAMRDSLTKINAQIAVGHPQVQQNQMAISNQDSYMANDPGNGWRLI